MASDDDYAAFLDKANQDTGAAPSTRSATMATKAVDADVPRLLRHVDAYYVSDADEPFEPVSLRWDGDAMPSEAEFATLIGPKSGVSSIGRSDFDARGQYGGVVEAVEQAAGADAAFFRVGHGGTRAEYYVVGLDKKGARIVGLKAMAVES